MHCDNFKPIFDFLQLFKDITECDQELVSQQLQFRKVTEGEVLLQEGKLAKELFFVCKGILKIVSFNEKGNPVIHFFMKEQRFCTILKSLNDSIPANESIIAACDAELIVIAKDKLLYLYHTLPYFKGLTTNIFQQSLLEKIKVRNSYMGEDATIRYQKFISQQPDIALRVPLSDIASYLGITQQSLSRIRKNIR